MPHATLRLAPGVNTNETPTLNSAGVASSNLIRYIPDPHGAGGLIQKLGGWTRYFTTAISGIVRALWPWEDTNANKWLGVGTDVGDGGVSKLMVLDGVQQSSGLTTATQAIDITPSVLRSDVTPSFQTLVGSSLVTVVDGTTLGITAYDSVFIATPIAIGGLVLSGLYPVVANAGGSAYQIRAVDAIGAPLNATLSTSGGATPSFTSTLGSATVSVAMTNHGFAQGSNFPILLPVAVGGMLLYGNFLVESVVDANTFTILGPQTATGTLTVAMNDGKARFIYTFGTGPAVTTTGYGVGGYGVGGYGSGVPVPTASGNPISTSEWVLDNWGQQLIACPVGCTVNGTPFSGIFAWDPTSRAPFATVLANAPPVNDGVFVAMPQRQLVAWGSTFTGIQDPLLLRWCDIEDYSVWDATVTNQAGSFRISKGSRIVGCLQGPQQGLVWTDLGLWSMHYISQPYVYSFNEIGDGCGLIARKAAVVMNDTVFWMSQTQFWQMSGAGIAPIPCPIWDTIFQDLDATNLSKIRAAANSQFSEVAWYYPVKGGSGENTAYVKYNTLLQAWDFGVLGRSAWVDQSVLGPPIGADPVSRYIYQHETSPDADGRALTASFSTGYTAISEGDLKVFVDQIWPDMKWGYYSGAQNATVELTFRCADYPGQEPRVIGPYSVTKATKFISPRMRSRLLQISVSSSDVGSFWRIGAIRYRFQPDGKY